MPHGFFTVEQWKSPTRGAPLQWVAILHVNADQSLTAAIESLQERGKPGFYRVIQTQRMIWGEMVNSRLLLRRWHTGSPEGLARNTTAFERDKGVWNVAAAKALRARSKLAMKAKAGKATGQRAR